MRRLPLVIIAGLVSTTSLGFVHFSVWMTAGKILAVKLVQRGFPLGSRFDADEAGANLIVIGVQNRVLDSKLPH